MPITLSRDEYATATESAAICGMSDSRLRQLAADGRLPPAVKTPLGTLWDRRTVEEFARARAAKRAQNETPAT